MMKNQHSVVGSFFAGMIVLLACLVLVVPCAEAITWKQCRSQPMEWYGSGEAIRIADQVLLYQRINGGWLKNKDMAKPLSEEESTDLSNKKHGRSSATIDNGATITPMRFLAKVYQQTSDEKYAQAVVRGVDFILSIQYPNGGWPQHPHRDGYHLHITYNDNAMINVLTLLDDIASGDSLFTFIDDTRKQQCADAVSRGIECILNTQIVVDGKMTAWCAQHHETTLEPASARIYEKVSLSGSESVGVVEFLMSRPDPDDRIREAVISAMRWFDEAALEGIRIVRKEDASLPKGFDKIVVRDETAPRVWARFYEIDTNKPIFCGRDGIVKERLSEIEHERRVGYSWYTTRAEKLFTDTYPQWRETWLQ